MKNYIESAAALFDGGWRKEDKDQLMSEYGLAETEACEICAELAEMEPKAWYAVLTDHDDLDWGTGSHDRETAAKMVHEYIANGHPDAYIAVIEGDICVDEITVEEA